jgi:TRAP-type mannitol/chloroaromatic compound transport system permease large subunit
MMKKVAVVAFGVGAAGSALATSIVDYSTLMTSVSGELTAGIAAAVVVVGTIWGAKIGVRFVRSLLH